MKNFDLSLRAVILLIGTLTAASCAGSQPVEEFPDLIMHGESYPNICNPTQSRDFYNTILHSNATDAKSAWMAVNTILCSPRNATSHFYIRVLFSSTLRKYSSSTGEKDVVEKVAPSDALVEEVMANGRAWNVDLRTERKKISLQYFKDEACIRAVVLSFSNGKWMINEIGEACD